MTDEQHPMVKLDIPYFMEGDATPQPSIRAIEWCESHWGKLLSGLHARGLGRLISGSAEELTEKLQMGDTDPCWEACNMVNMAAMQIFGPNKIIDEHGGCPACAFTHVTDHVADIMARQFLEPQ